ncbi:MAG: prepilin-type N-terminal cleavage/methylation domain-containing protein [Deltaproteobacteria bacterium]|nr:prepilin-type N-terminal cleavage/methylation domain-containing protein [Deltaproteobacteria bacterium]
MKLLRRVRECGFSLIELLVGIVIGMLILAAATMTFITQSKSFDAQEQINEMQQNARAAMDLIVREVKMAGYDPLGVAFDGIPYNASQLTIRADLNADGDYYDANENIIYSHNAGDLSIRRDAGGEKTLAENIQGFVLTYLDGAGNTTTTTANIRQIRIVITARTSKRDPNYSQNGGYRTYQLTASVTPPNLDY